MFRRRFEKVAVMLLSIAMLLTSTGIVSSLAYGVSESSATPSTSSSQASTSASSSTVAQEGGEISTPSVEQEGGAIVVIDEGNGTKDSPYQISSVEQFLSIGGKVNNTSNSDKYFVLTADIDLSGVSGNDFAKNGGSLIGIDKTLSATSENVFIIFDGNGYSLKGLDVEIATSDEASIFGTLNSKSVVKNLKIEKPVVKSTSGEMKDIALVATKNEGTISSVTVTYPVLTVEKAQNTAFIVAENYGTVSNVTIRGSHTNISAASLENHTISSTGNAGAVAGLNYGIISNVSALNIGMYIPETESAVIYGGISGANSGSVLNSVSTGNVMGGKATDTSGGIVGKAVKPLSGNEVASTLNNNYSLVAISTSVSGCGIIGAEGTAEMVKDCYWSSEVSGRNTAVKDFGCGANEISSTEFIIIPQGSKASLSADDVKAGKWGKATFELDGAITIKGEGVSSVDNNGAVEITADASGKVAYATYNAKIMLPSDVGSASAGNTLKQYFRVEILTVSEDAQGDGSAENPFVVTTANDFNLLKYAPGMNVVLGNNISVNSYVSSIKGTLDGNGFTINTAKPLVKAVYGEVKNLNVVVTADISSPVFGDAVSAKLSGVRVAMAEGVSLKANSDNSGILFGRIGGESALDSVQVKGNIVISKDNISSIGAFAGLVDGEKVVITNSGAVSDVKAEENIKASSVAIFAGKVTGKEVSVSDGYLGGANFAGEYSFIGSAESGKLTVKNIYTSLSSEEGSAEKFASFNGFDANEFRKWDFDGGNVGFFTGNGGEFTINLPQIAGFGEDFEVIGDATKLVGSVSVAEGRLTLKVQRAQGVVTVKSIPVTVINTKTGLSATINVSNGLEKDAEGRYTIHSAYDLAYISENIAELSTSSFIMMSDVDMADLDSFAPVGSAEESFKGTFDGNGKVIANLTINANAKVGLFTVLDGATVKNVKFTGANVSAEAGYVGVLAGQVIGNATVEGITVENSKVSSKDLYAAAVVGAIDGTTNSVAIKDIEINNVSVKSESSYVGSIAGRINSEANVENVSVSDFNAEGSNYVAGLVGLANGEVAISNADVTDADIRGVSEISGIVSGTASVKDSAIRNSEISTIAITSAYTAGGVSAILSGKVENVTVENTKISAGVSAGVVAKTQAEGKLTINNASVISCEIVSSRANTVASGILGVHNVKGTVSISGASVDAQTVISGAAVSAGLVGDCSGAESYLNLAESKSLATVNGATTENAVSASGALGRVGISAVNNVKISNVSVGGAVSGKGSVGGIIGIIKNGTKFAGSEPLVSDCIVFAQLGGENAESSALIFGAIEGEVISSENISSAVKNVVLSTFGGMKAYPSENLSGGYVDMNSGITPSVNTLTTTDEATVEISNLPQVSGFVFDSSTGWISESSERISVVSSSENSVILKANRRADIAIIAYYVLSSDEEIRVPVGFGIVANVYEPLEGKGTAALPYLIKDAYDLESMVNYADKSAYFVLAEDIVLTDEDYEFGGAFYNVGNGIITIGNEIVAFNGKFSGLYEGKIHSITNLRTEGNTFGGLFGATDSAVISDLIINCADISASANAGVLIGRAYDTTIKNVTVNTAKVETTQAGSLAGGLVGFAQSTMIESVTLNDVTVSTTLDSTSATLEIAGGVAGIYDGLVKKTSLNNVYVESATVGGGVVGVVRGDPANLADVSADVNVKAEIAGGFAGRISSPKQLYVNGCILSGAVEGEQISAGVVAEITSVSSDDAFSKLNRSFVKDTVIVAEVTGGDVKAVVIGEVSETVATDDEIEEINVFSEVYYSSYQNPFGAFGSEMFNAYRNSEYIVTDINSLSYVIDSTVYPAIELTTEFAELDENSIILNNAEGTYKSFTAAGRVFELSTITSDKEGLVEYNAETSEVRLTSAASENAKLVFVYSNGLKTAIDISSEYALMGSGTKENPYLISTADDFAFMLGNSSEGKYYALTQDVSLAGVEGGADFSGNLDGNGYVLYDYSGVALFGRMSGALENLGFAGFDVSDDKSDSVGAVAIVLDGATVENCFVIADVKANGKSQDAGVLSGRAINGAIVKNSVVSGKVVSENGFATGGVVGSAVNSQIENVTSTVYVLGGDAAGGIVGEASYSTINNVIFANMVESEGESGNLIGKANENTTITNGIYDSSTARINEAEAESVKAYTTEKLVNAKVDGFVSLGGYPVPETLAEGGSDKFITGVQFVSVEIRYVSGVGAGTVYNYTDIVAETTVNSNEVQLETDNDVKLTLLPTVDYADAQNEIARYMNPLDSEAVDISCTIVAENSEISEKLIGVMLKTKVGENAESFDFFTSVKAQPVSISSAAIADDRLYVNMHLPVGYGFTVVAVDENGNTINTTSAGNEGILVEANGAKNISLTLTLSKENGDWGKRSIWSVIGK